VTPPRTISVADLTSTSPVRRSRSWAADALAAAVVVAVAVAVSALSGSRLGHPAALRSPHSTIAAAPGRCPSEDVAAEPTYPRASNVVVIVLTNRGQSRCTVRGYPAVVLRGGWPAGFQVLPIPVPALVQHRGADRPVELAPGEAAACSLTVPPQAAPVTVDRLFITEVVLSLGAPAAGDALPIPVRLATEIPPGTPLPVVETAFVPAAGGSR
jgi:Protein of unknown function (DUF4232)